jgi:hypothetical protein
MFIETPASRISGPVDIDAERTSEDDGTVVNRAIGEWKALAPSGWVRIPNSFPEAIWRLPLGL